MEKKKKKINWLAWNNILKPKHQDGSGLVKQTWRLCKRQKSLLFGVLRAKVWLNIWDEPWLNDSFLKCTSTVRNPKTIYNQTIDICHYSVRWEVLSSKLKIAYIKNHEKKGSSKYLHILSLNITSKINKIQCTIYHFLSIFSSKLVYTFSLVSFLWRAQTKVFLDGFMVLVVVWLYTSSF